MPKISEVDFDTIKEICVEMLATGNNPSFPSVYERLGRKGSAKVVQDMITRWRKETGQRFFARRARPGVPEELHGILDELAVKLWEAALIKADSQYEQHYQAHEKLQQELQASLTATQEEFTRESQCRLEMEARLQTSVETMETLNNRLAQWEKTGQELHSQLALREQKLSMQEAVLTQQEARIATLTQQHEQALVELLQQQEALLQVEKDRYTTLLVQEQKLAALELSFIKQQLMEAQQAATDYKAQWQSESVQFRQELDSCMASREHVREEAASWRGRAEILQNELTQVQTQSRELHEAMRVAAQDHQRLRDDNALLQKRLEEFEQQQHSPAPPSSLDAQDRENLGVA